MDRRARPTPAWAPTLVLGSILSVQFGGALAVTLIPLAGVMGSVLLRLTLAAVILAVAVRPSWRGHRARDWWVVLWFGLSLAAMNSAFYGAVARLPMGVAVTLEFLGPLTLAAATSRSVRDLLAVALALAGVLLISGALWTPWTQLDLVGIGLALLAGAGWAMYILASGHTARHFEGIDGVAWAMLIAAVLVTPWGLVDAGGRLLGGQVLGRGLGVALLSSVVPYSLENIALRWIAPNVFGVLMSLEPAVAAMAGLVVLGQRLVGTEWAGIALVIAASIVIRVAIPGRRALRSP
ncbi:EamA family transporter [Raineyella sp. LH-20]|uniref:EamA family transporter n=1 Tax=Raineyella sp. LH-20 TaxID=3081204 RepID=UPI002952D971|nr:EamA family transporter [Raineyella sp. LH-20]WOP19991.1 EamA family transporter [Raineyella sp. LH-20]